MELNDLKDNMVISVRGGFGNSFPTMAIIIEVVEANYDGEEGIIYRAEGSNSDKWAYLNQIDEIITGEAAESFLDEYGYAA